MHGVGNDFAVEVNIGFGIDGDLGERGHVCVGVDILVDLQFGLQA